jgi:hypothetical protein
MAITTDETRQRAVAKALAHGGAGAVERVRHGRYRVASNSRPGTWHTVAGTALDGADLRCDCEAGVAHRLCWHVASVWLARLAHAGVPAGALAAVVTETAAPGEDPGNVVAFPQRAA